MQQSAVHQQRGGPGVPEAPPASTSPVALRGAAGNSAASKWKDTKQMNARGDAKKETPNWRTRISCNHFSLNQEEQGGLQNSLTPPLCFTGRKASRQITDLSINEQWLFF